MGVYFEETATICFESKDGVGATQKIVLSSKAYPWYLDDGTARVYVMGAQSATGFSDTLNKYLFTEPVTKLFEIFPFMKDLQILQHNCCEYVLEIGTPLTLVGRAERDKDGDPIIGQTYEVFNGHVKVDELISNLESDSKYYGDVSSLLTAIGVAIFAVRVLHIPLDITKSRR